jgi:hypothetical protein
MATRFGDLWRDRYAKLHGSFGELYFHLPMGSPADSRVAPAPDQIRSVCSVKGIYMDAPERLNVPDAYDQRTDQRPGVMGGKPSIEIFPAIDSGVTLKPGDHLLRQADGLRWRIVDIGIDDEGVAVCSVHLLG